MLETSLAAVTMDRRVILVTDASMPTGRLAAYALAEAGHTVYVGIPEARGRNAGLLVTFVYYAREHGVELYPVDLDASSADSLEAMRSLIIVTCGRLDATLHEPPAQAVVSGARPQRPSSAWGAFAYAASVNAARPNYEQRRLRGPSADAEAAE